LAETVREHQVKATPLNAADTAPAQHVNGEARLAYGVEEFARLIGLGRTSVFELIRQGKLKTVMVGGRRLIPVEAGRLLLGGAP
jgi:excisionase family DNA binding protein